MMKKNLTSKNLANGVGDSGTLTPLLKKLEKKDYVVRTREEKDEEKLINLNRTR